MRWVVSHAGRRHSWRTVPWFSAGIIRDENNWESANPALYQAVTTPNNYLLGKYQAIDPVKVAVVTD